MKTVAVPLENWLRSENSVLISGSWKNGGKIAEQSGLLWDQGISSSSIAKHARSSWLAKLLENRHSFGD
jgi:hypothetical protein